MPQRAELFELMFAHSIDGVMLTRATGEILRANPAVCRMLGRTEEEIRRLGRAGIVGDSEEVRAAVATRARTGAVAGVINFLHADGSAVPVEYTSVLMPDPGDPDLAIAIARDITLRRRTEDSHERTRRALHLRTHCDEAVLRAVEEESLYQALCRIAVEVGGFRAAWIAVSTPGDASSTQIVARAVRGSPGSPSTTDLAASPHEDCPLLSAARGGDPIVRCCCDNKARCPMHASSSGARTDGCCHTFPLSEGPMQVGQLSIQSDRCDSLEADEVVILTGLAHNVAHAVAAIRVRRAHERASERSAGLGAATEAFAHDVDSLPRMLDAVARHGRGLLCVDECEVRLLSGDRTWLELGALSCGDPDAAPTLRARDAMQPIRADDARFGPPIRDGVVTRAQRDADTELVAPLRAAGEVRGALVLRRRGAAHAPFSDDDVAFAEQLADRGALAIHNAELFAQARLELEQRRRAEAEAQRLAAVIEQAAEMVLVTDVDGAIQYVNPAVERVTGDTRAELLGSNPRVLKSGAQDVAFYRELWATIKGGGTWRGRLVNKKKDGTPYTEDAVISPVRDDDGRISGFVGLKRDVTETLSLEAQLRQAQKMDGIGRLAGGVAHDFNNLLSVILSTAHVVLETLAPADPLREDLGAISEAGSRAAALTRQLLAFSRRQVLAPVPIELNRVIKEMRRMLERLLAEDIELVEELAPALDIVKADPSQIEQVLLNLVVNARDAMPRGGCLVVRTQNVALKDADELVRLGLRAGPYVRLCVEDTGVGMDEETRSKIFEPFFTTKPQGKGTGLGLSTVYGIVAQSGGAVDVESRPGEGSCFCVYLPRADGAVVDAKAERETRGAGGSETVLLVEDDAALRKVFARILERSGYRVLTAHDGIDGLRVFQERRHEIDLVLSDVVMPSMSGPAFVERAREERPNLRVLFMSGYTDDALGNHGVLDPDTDLVNKPVTHVELLRRVRAALDRSAPATGA